MRLAVLLAVPALVAGAAQAQTPVNIAVVNIDRVLSEARPIRQVLDELDQDVANRQRELDRSESELMDLMETYRSQQAILSEEARSQMQRDIVERQLALDELESDIRSLLDLSETEIITPAMERVYQAIREVADGADIDLVLRSDAAVFVEEDLDLTEEVITLLNQRGDAADTANLPD
jgi:outer membrane protein